MYKLRFVTAIFFSFIFLNPVISQTTVLDSLIKSVESQPDSTKYPVLRHIARILTDTDPIRSNQFMHEALDVAKRNNNQRRVASALKGIALNHTFLSEFDSAYTYFEKAIETYSKASDSLNMIITMENMAVAYQRNNQPEKAIELYYDVIKTSDQMKDWEGVVSSRINIASLLINQESFDQAIFHLKEIIDIYEREEDNKEARQIIQNYSPTMYINLGIAYQELNQADTALFYYSTSLKLSKEVGDEYIASYAYNSIGDYHKDQKADWNTALENYESALEGFKSIQDPRGVVLSKVNVANMHNKIGNYRQANRLLLEAVDQATQLEYQEVLRDAYQYLSENAEASGDYQNSLEYFQLFSSFKDSLFSNNRDKLLQKLEIEYETEKKQAEIARLDAENKLKERQQLFQLIIFIISLLIVLGVAYLLYTRYKLRKQREAAEFERNVNVALNRFVPNEFIETLGKKHIMEVELGDQVERVITILFTDIRSYTSISEGMTPTEIFQFVKRYAERMGPIIQKNGGFINQYLGDGIMAIFKNSPDDCLQACIEMQQSLSKLNQELLNEGEKPIRVGMGMHTGPLVLGIIGDEKRRDVAMISDTVNTAARIESITKEIKAPILVSGDSLELIQNKENFNVRALGEVLVKGKKKPVKIFECYNIDDTPLLSLKQQTIDTFNRAVKAFGEKKFEESKEYFTEVLELNPNDAVSLSFVERCAQNGYK